VIASTVLPRPCCDHGEEFAFGLDLILDGHERIIEPEDQK
jgi:hypothetical protein